MENNWKRFGLPVLLMLVMLAALVEDIIIWMPHGDSGFISGVVSLAAGIYGIVAARRCWCAADRGGFVAAICMLVIAVAVFWISNTFPFCPECDGGVHSPLMRWILADKL